jgi:hypothetical protein
MEHVIACDLLENRKGTCVWPPVDTRCVTVVRLAMATKSGEGFRLIAGGVLGGILLAIVMSRVLRSFLFEVQPGDPITFIVVGALLVGVGLLACWGPARRAGKVDPLEALRYE